ncbi:hypothetical protein GCM10009863_12510 [Streptomyces axinellae]|uniref:Uncharacterized protein n=1 Tax=Streptomyces axinellae TaxID=552788 RepID=A0ABP6C5V1_9ACTN
MQAALVDGLDEEFLHLADPSGEVLDGGVAGEQGLVLVAQRHQAGGLAADDGGAGGALLGERPGEVGGLGAGVVHQALGQARPSAAPAALQPYAPARLLQQFGGRAADGGFGVGGERVGQERQFALGGRRCRDTRAGGGTSVGGSAAVTAPPAD